MERKRMSGKLKEFPKTQTKDQLLKDWEDIERQLKYKYPRRYKKYFDFDLLNDWFDFGFMFRIYKNSKFANYYFSVDIQIMWLNLWMRFIRK